MLLIFIHTAGFDVSEAALVPNRIGALLPETIKTLRELSMTSTCSPIVPKLQFADVTPT